MSNTLWTFADFLAATGGALEGAPGADVTGISIDSRTLAPGNAFFAIVGDRLDGHAYVKGALDGGASVAVIERGRLKDPVTGPLIVVDDTLTALEQVARAARARTEAGIVAVTGSVGKTGTKEALRLTLSRSGAVHASQKSYNNHWGVPLSLSQMPRETAFGVFEIGMNHPGEITPLVDMVRPHVAIITTVAPVHIEFFESEEEIARAKAEIFSGVVPGGTAVLNRDNRHFDLLSGLAREAGVARIVSFGEAEDADVRLLKLAAKAECSCVSASVFGQELTYKVGAPGRHLVDNSLAVLAAVHLLGANLALAGLALAEFAPPSGRGARHTLWLRDGKATLIDESYNANPVSMRAAISLLAASEPTRPGRRIAVLGDMLELGEESQDLHADLAGPLLEAKVDRVYCAGPEMRALWEALPNGRRGAYGEKASEIESALRSELMPGDVIMIKGSAGSKMTPVAEALQKRFARPTEKNV